MKTKAGQSLASSHARNALFAALALGLGLLTLIVPSSAQTPSPPPVASPTAAPPLPPSASDYTNPKDGSIMVNVPAGEFFMGASPRDQDAQSQREQPGRKVTLPAYQIGKYEVTNAQYARFVKATGTRWEDKYNLSINGEQAPVVGVSWDEADAYCRWAGLRLPSEAEWERAARGTDQRIYPWGDNWDPSRAVHDTTGPAEVGSKPAGISPVGCLDMAGNVWEWTNDWYDPKQKNKVKRGGSWSEDSPLYHRCSLRFGDSRDYRYINLGFRCARTP